MFDTQLDFAVNNEYIDIPNQYRNVTIIQIKM